MDNSSHFSSRKCQTCLTSNVSMCCFSQFSNLKMSPWPLGNCYSFFHYFLTFHQTFNRFVEKITSRLNNKKRKCYFQPARLVIWTSQPYFWIVCLNPCIISASEKEAVIASVESFQAKFEFSSHWSLWSMRMQFSNFLHNKCTLAYLQGCINTHIPASTEGEENLA